MTVPLSCDECGVEAGVAETIVLSRTWWERLVDLPPRNLCLACLQARERPVGLPVYVCSECGRESHLVFPARITTWWERISDVDVDRICSVCYLGRTEEWKRASWSGKAAMEIQALEDERVFRALDQICGRQG